jgi:hypothetical protein
MKIKNINNLIDKTISKEFKRIINEELNKDSRDYYHVTLEGQPIETFESYEDAEQYVMDNKDKHDGKELLIDKKKYNSYEEMIDHLDEMGEQLENEKNTNMKKKINEEFSYLNDDTEMQEDMYEDDSLEGDMSEYDMEEGDMYEDDSLEGDMSEYNMEEGDMYEDEVSDDISRLLKKYGGKGDIDDVNEYEETPDESEMKEVNRPSPRRQFEKDLMHDKDYLEMILKSKGKGDSKMGSIPNAITNDLYNKSKHNASNLELDDYYDDLDNFNEESLHGIDGGDEFDRDISEGAKMCSECGSMLNEEGVCSECASKSMEEYDLSEDDDCMECNSSMEEETDDTLYESKKRKLILKESELIELIKKMINESIPGKIAADKSRAGSKKENDAYYSEVGKKMKDYLNIEGNDNPEFPHQIGKGEKVARQNTSEQDSEVARNFAGLQNLDYDIEPSDKFKERLKMAIEGDSKMGNGVITEKPTIKPSNGADKGKDAKEKTGNNIKTDTAKKINKQVVDRKKNKDNRKLYKKEDVPVNTSKKEDKNLNESKVSKDVLDDIEKMKKLTTYNKRTQ